MKNFNEKTIELLQCFESAYSAMWEEYCEIVDYAQKNYDGGVRQLVEDVSQSCDYFSLSKPLRLFLNQCNFEGCGTMMPANGCFSDGANQKSQNQPPEEDFV